MPYCVGGAKSEGNWRTDFRAAGLPVAEPEIVETTATTSNRPSSSVEVGIGRVYAAFRRNEIAVFDDLPFLLDELESYSRKIDDVGNPQDEIEDKSTYHVLDAVRYIVAHIRKDKPEFVIGLPDPEHGQGSVVMRAPEGVFSCLDEQRRMKREAKGATKNRSRWAEDWEPPRYTTCCAGIQQGIPVFRGLVLATHQSSHSRAGQRPTNYAVARKGYVAMTVSYCLAPSSSYSGWRPRSVLAAPGSTSLRRQTRMAWSSPGPKPPF
jgi:hypothetical protein